MEIHNKIEIKIYEDFESWITACWLDVKKWEYKKGKDKRWLIKSFRKNEGKSNVQSMSLKWF